MNTIKEEPVITATAVIGAIMAVGTFAVAMGWLNITPEQGDAFRAMLVSVVPLLIAVVPGLIARANATSLANPKDREGRKLVPEK